MDTQLPKLLQPEGEESIDIAKLLSTVPLVVQDTPDAREVADYLLPFGIGIEFECDQGEDYDVRAFEEIDGIVEVRVDSAEQRYRIVKGFDGLKALYRLSRTLIRYSRLNLGSGIHYHIGLNDYFEDFVQLYEEDKDHILKDTILKELDKWNYEGTYNRRAVTFHRTWVRLNKHYQTAEVRIGEMTFNYELLFKRITHACSIFRECLDGFEQKRLIKDNPWLLYEDQDIKEILSKRVKKINPNVRNN